MKLSHNTTQTKILYNIAFYFGGVLTLKTSANCITLFGYVYSELNGEGETCYEWSKVCVLLSIFGFGVFGVQGWRSGESTRLPPIPTFDLLC